MVSGQFVGTLVEHLVVEYVTHDAHVATYEVVNMNRLSGFNLEPHYILFSLCNELVNFFFWH